MKTPTFALTARKFAFLAFSTIFLAHAFSQPNEGFVSVKNGISSSVEVATRISQDEVPELLRGIWQGSDRLVMFSGENEFALVLRFFYQWYSDRAA